MELLQRNDNEEVISSLSKLGEINPHLITHLHHNALLLKMITQSLPPSACHPILFIPLRLLLVLEPTVGSLLVLGNVPTAKEVCGLEAADCAVEVGE